MVELTPKNMRLSLGNIDGRQLVLVSFLGWNANAPTYTPEIGFPVEQVKDLTKSEFIEIYGDRFTGGDRDG